MVLSPGDLPLLVRRPSPCLGWRFRTCRHRFAPVSCAHPGLASLSPYVLTVHPSQGRRSPSVLCHVSPRLPCCLSRRGRSAGPRIYSVLSLQGLGLSLSSVAVEGTPGRIPAAATLWETQEHHPEGQGTGLRKGDTGHPGPPSPTERVQASLQLRRCAFLCGPLAPSGSVKGLCCLSLHPCPLHAVLTSEHPH